MTRLAPPLAVLLGVLPALVAAPVPKAVKRDPLVGEWVVTGGAWGAHDFHTLHVTADSLWWEGWPAGTVPVAWEVEEDSDGERFLVLLDSGHGRRRHPFTLADGELVIGDRVCESSVTLRRER